MRRACIKLTASASIPIAVSLFTLAILVSLATVASAAVLKGIVYDEETGKRVAVAIITVGEESRYVTTATGRFRFENLGTGPITLTVEHVGYQRWSDEVDLSEDQETHVTVTLKPRAWMLEPVEVSSPRPDLSVPQGKREIEPMRIRRAAGAVATDLLRVVQSLPGAAAAGDDFSNRYVVRGGEPEENLVMVDGFTLLQPVHLEGFTSVVYDDLIGGVDVLPGALPPRFGDALSSVTSLEILRPDSTRKFFRYDLGSIALGAKGKGKGLEALGAGRASFYNLIVRRPPGIDKRSFQDLSLKVSHTRGTITTSLLGVASRDREEGQFDRSVDAVLAGLRIGNAPGNTMWHADLSFADRDRVVEVERPYSKTVADLQRIDGSASLIRLLNPSLQVRADVEARSERFEGVSTSHNGTGAAFSAEGTWMAEPITLALGGRIEQIPFTKGVPVSPYVSIRLRDVGPIVAGAGWRIARQSPFHLSEIPDVAGLPVDPADLLEAGADEIDPIEAHHISVSLSADLGLNLVAAVEVYEKRYDKLLTWDLDGPDPESLDNDGDGRGRGIELSLRKEVGRWATGWVSYVYSKTRKREGPSLEMRPADHDRPKMLQGALDIALRGKTTLTFSYRAASGRPITPLTGVGDGTIVPGLINSERLPSYRRIDAKLEHRIEGKKNDAFLYLDVLNLTNRKNIVDAIQFVGIEGRVERIYQRGVTFLPVAGFGFYF